jgi:hypothetical protein
MKRLLSLSLAALALTALGTAHAEDPVEPLATAPAREVPLPPSSVRLKLALGGIAIAGGAYAVSYGMASYFPEVPGMSGFKVPIVGPWIALGKSGCADKDPDCAGGKVVLRGFLFVLDGLAQLGGLGLIAEGILVKTDASDSKKASAFTIRPTPLVTGSVTGLGFVGTF